jgi:hypothetical protein
MEKNMRAFGTVLMAIGALAALGAFTLDTAVASLGGPYGLPERTQNLGLLQFQMMVLQTGLASFIAGAVLVGSGEAPSASRHTATDEEQERRYRKEDAYDRLNKAILVVGVVVMLGLIMAYAFR